MSDILQNLIFRIESVERRLKNLSRSTSPSLVFLQSPLTSASWSGSSHSTTSKTLLDLSAVFGVPAGIKAIFLRVVIQDSGAASNQCVLYLAPNNTSGQGVCFRCVPSNDYWSDDTSLVPCSSSGDLYYQIVASGSSTLDVILQVWGYVL